MSVQDILEALPIEEIIEDAGLDYKITRGSSGEQLNVKECPFCGSSDWKVYLNRETGRGNCFRCDEKWSAFKFLKQALGCSDGVSLYIRLQDVARRLGWRPPRKAANPPTEPEEWSLPQNVALPTEDGKMPVYLTERGVTPEVARDFDLRWCSRGFFPFVNGEGETKHQPYIHRILIPVRDLDGTIVTFQGRAVAKDAERKYLFPPGLPGSGSFLYNGHRAKGASKVVLVEGAFDVIGATVALRTHAIDVPVIGSFGKHLSDDGQMSRLLALKAQGLREIAVMWDGERAAYDAAIATAVRLHALGFKASVCALPPGRDPGDARASDIISGLAAAAAVTPLTAIGLRLRNPYR